MLKSIKGTLVFCSISLSLAPAIAAPYDQIVSKMQRLEASHPELVSRFELGHNDQRQTIWGWRFENTSAPVNETKSKLLVVGVHHGNEEQSASVATRFADDLISEMSGSKGSSFASLSNRIIYVIPVLNIGGYNSSRREEYTAANRSTDPNRDYPDPCTDDQSYKLSSTRALSDFVKSEGIIGAVTIHGYIGTFTYPWGTFTDTPRTLDDAAYRKLAALGAAQNGYKTGTHGQAIYPTAGAFEDWAYYELGVWTMLLEIRRGADVGRDSKAMLAYFANVPNQRSFNNAHVGQCTRTGGFIKARP